MVRHVAFVAVLGCVGAEVDSRDDAVQHGFEDTGRYDLANGSVELMIRPFQGSTLFGSGRGWDAGVHARSRNRNSFC